MGEAMSDVPTMNAAVLAAPGDLTIQRLPVPQIKPDEVLLKVSVAGVCGSDVGEFDHGPVLTPLSAAHAVTGHHGPIVLGHEFSGVVVGVGANVTKLREGDVVASGSGVSCGSCSYCMAGRTNLCDDYWTVGFHRDGALAEFCAVPESVCAPVADYDLTPDAAALAQPMSVAIHSMDRGAPIVGSRVAVVGVGGVGAFLVAALRVQSGAAEIVAIEPHASRRSVAAELGADRVLAPDDAPREYFDVVYEVSGSAAGFLSAVSMARRGGVLVLVGLQSPGREIGDFLRQIPLRELTVTGPIAHTFETSMPRALEVLAARDDWSLVAPTVHPLHELAALLTTPSGDAIKVLFDPQATRARPASY